MSGKDEGIQETPQQRALTELATRQLEDYRRRWLPLQMDLSRTITEMGAPDSRERRQARGLASTETEARYSSAREKLEGGLGATGQLGSSKGKMALTGLSEDQATSTGLGLAGADRQIENAYTTGLANIMKLGQGQRADAMGGMANDAAMSARRAAADASASLERRMGNAQLVGKVAGRAYVANSGKTDPGYTIDTDGMGIGQFQTMPNGEQYDPRAGRRGQRGYG